MARSHRKRDNAPPVAWLFQLNPDYFRTPEEADLYVVQCSGRQSAWYVGQNGKKMEVGHPVFVWRSAGKRGEGAGVIARGVIEAKPVVRTSFDWERPFEKRRIGKDLRAVLRITEVFTDTEGYLPKERLKQHWLLEELKIIRCPQGSNFPLNAAEVGYLKGLLKRRGSISPDIPRATTKLARISYNSSGWKNPTKEAEDLESSDTFNAQHGFGYEDWLFRDGWKLGGWRYAFIQAFNRTWDSLRGRVFDVSLFTIDGDGRRFAVGRITELEVLRTEEMAAAVAAFRKRGWRDVMRVEIATAGGKPAALEGSDWAPYFLNVRFRAENVRLLPPGTLMPTDLWMANRRRYSLYDFNPTNTVFDLWSFRGRRARKLAKVKGTRTRRGSDASEVDPIHERMQEKLEKKLRRQFPGAKIDAEEDWIDLKVRTRDSLTLYEIKTDVRPFMVIRQALGQLLEYAFHPRRHHGLPVKMVIVGRTRLTPVDEQYLAVVQQAFRITYEALPV